MDLAINLDYILFICLYAILSINQDIDLGIVQMSYVFKGLFTYLFLHLYICTFVCLQKDRIIDNSIVRTFEVVKPHGY